MKKQLKRPASKKNMQGRRFGFDMMSSAALVASLVVIMTFTVMVVTVLGSI